MEKLFHLLLKMLVVLHAAPVASPTETMRFKSLFAKVVVVDFVGKLFASVHIVGGLVAHHLALLDVIVEVVMIEGEITEVVIAYVGLAFHRLALHPGSHFLGNKHITVITQRVFGLENDRRDLFFN